MGRRFQDTRLTHTHGSLVSFRHRLASMEIARFQEQFVNRLLEEMTQINNMQHAGAPGTAGHELAGHGPDNNWTFARAFLYSLTILTTIGKSGGRKC